LATAVFTDLDVDVENTLESLHPVIARWRSAGLLSHQPVSRPSD
jgi:hypothetical protein